jgi:protein TonB
VPPGPPSGGAPEGAPGRSAPSPGDSPFGGRAFSLLRPPIEVPSLPRLPGGGGTRSEGEGAGDAGRQREGGPAIPLNKPPDEDYAEYFLKVKRAIEDKWSYPTEAARKGQSGQLVLEFVIRKDGGVSVEMTRSSGIAVLDTYAINAVRLASPYPPLPSRLGESLRISANFSYILDHGFRVFGLQ